MTSKKLLAVVAATLLISGSVLPAQSRPPVPYESHGACPFECCTYRTWTVEADTDILADRREDAPVAFRVRRGDQVRGLTGVVVTTGLGRAVVRRQATIGEQRLAVKPGEALYILHYVGEGYWKYWLRGKIDQDQIPDRESGCVDARRAPIECDVQITEEPETVWWAKIRGPGGREGWTRQLDHFGNIDACG